MPASAIWQSYLLSATMFSFHMHFLWYSATAHNLFMGLFSTSVYSFFWRRAIFILNPALPSRLVISLHFLFSSAFIHHIPPNSCKQPCAAICQLRHMIHFVHSSHLSQWRSIEETEWNENPKTDVLLNSSSYVLWPRQCLLGCSMPRTQWQ